MNDSLRNLPRDLTDERGGSYGFVCIWRGASDEDSGRTCSVGEFLAKPENQSGTWMIDGGWGGPPGPIHVRWDDTAKAWENGGYCGRNFGE